MLQSFGDKVKGSKVLSYLIIGIISVPFALFGIQSYLGGYGEPVAATVNKTEISVRELDREAQNQRQRLAQNFGGKIPAAFDAPELFRNQALDSLIKKKVLEQYLDQYKYAISNQDLSSKILEDENYLKDGKFDKEFYEAQIASLGYSVPQFEMVMREYARLNQIQNGIISSSFILTSENDRLTNLKNQKRALTYYELKSADFTEQVTVSDSEIETYYDKNKTRYKYPEKVKIDYIELKISEVANQINVTEDDIKAQYETNKELYKSKETRNASHILLKVRSSDDDSTRDAIKEKMLTLRARIESGEDFADVAKAESQDIGSKSKGGELGKVAIGDMVQPFEEALFSMNIGDLSEPVLSNFGYHLIYLTDINTPAIQPYSEVRNDLEKDLKLKEADSIFYDLSEKIANQSYENTDNLEAASEVSNIAIKTSDWIEKNTFTGLVANRKVKDAIYSQQVFNDRQNSDLIELADDHVMVLRINEFVEAKQKTLSEVYEVVKKELITSKAEALLTAEANNIIDNLKSETSLTSTKATKQDKGLVDRNDTNIDNRILNALFKLSIKNGENSVTPIITVNDGVVVAVSNKVEQAPITPAVEPKDVLNSQAQNKGSIEYSKWINALKDKSDVFINRDVEAEQ